MTTPSSTIIRAIGAVALAGSTLLAHAVATPEQRVFTLSSHIADPAAAPKYVGVVTELKNAKVMQLQLRAGQVMERHSSEGEVLVLMLKGKAVFTFDRGEPVTIQAGQLLHLKPNENHVVRVLEDMEAAVTRVQP